MSGDLGLELHHLRGVPVLVVSGDLDVYSAAQLRVRGSVLAEQALADGGTRPGTDACVRSMVLDLSAAPFVDSAGMGAITALLRRIRGHRASLSLAGVNPHLTQMLNLMGLTRILTVYATVEDAVQAAVSEPEGGAAPG